MKRVMTIIIFLGIICTSLLPASADSRKDFEITLSQKELNASDELKVKVEKLNNQANIINAQWHMLDPYGNGRSESYEIGDSFPATFIYEPKYDGEYYLFKKRLN